MSISIIKYGQLIVILGHVWYMESKLGNNHIPSISLIKIIYNWLINLDNRKLIILLNLLIII